MGGFAALDGFSAAALIAGFVVSTIGFSVFLYGKKQQRVPQLVGGLCLMVLPMTGAGALLVWLLGLGITLGVWGAVRVGW